LYWIENIIYLVIWNTDYNFTYSTVCTYKVIWVNNALHVKLLKVFSGKCILKGGALLESNPEKDAVEKLETMENECDGRKDEFDIEKICLPDKGVDSA